MKKMTVRNLLVVFVSLAMVHALAASATIGIATAKGDFRVDESSVAGNATLFDGTAVETGGTTGEVKLSNSRVALDTKTRTRVYQGHMVLDQGKVQWSGPELRMEAGLLNVEALDNRSTAIVVRKGTSVVVGALSGNVKVMAKNGAMLRMVSGGSAFEFPQEQTTTPATNTSTDTETESQKKKKAGAAAGAVGGAAAGGAAAAAGISTGVVVAVSVGVAAAVAVPLAVVATRDNTSTTSRP